MRILEKLAVKQCFVPSKTPIYKGYNSSKALPSPPWETIVSPGNVGGIPPSYLTRAALMLSRLVVQRWPLQGEIEPLEQDVGHIGH